MEEIKGYSLKKQKLKKWIYINGYTQPQIAKILHLSVYEFKERLNHRGLFFKKQLERLIDIMGANAAFQVIYFPTLKQRNKVFYKTFGMEFKEAMRRYESK